MHNNGNNKLSIPIFLIILLFCGALIIRFIWFDYESGDYKGCLSSWYDYFVQNGQFKSLGGNFSNYYVPYLCLLSLSTLLPLSKIYAIKLISVVFDIFGAFIVYHLVRERYPSGNKALIATIFVFYLPTVVINSAVWGQCDMGYTAAMLAMVLCIIKNRPNLAAIAYGVAISLKPQAVYFAPFILGLLFTGDLKLRFIAISALTYIICGMPAVFAGKPFFNVILHWLHQENLPLLSANAPNLYLFIPNCYYETVRFIGLVLSAIVVNLLGFVIFLTRSKLKREEWLVASASISVLIMPFVLPGMHERYFFAADVLSIIYAFYFPKQWYVPLIVQFASLFSYFPYLFNIEPIQCKYLSLVMTAGIILVVIYYINPLVNIKKKVKI